MIGHTDGPDGSLSESEMVMDRRPGRHVFMGPSKESDTIESTELIQGNQVAE